MIFAFVFIMDIDLWFSILGMFLCDFGIRVILENKGILEVLSLSLFSESTKYWYYYFVTNTHGLKETNNREKVIFSIY